MKFKEDRPFACPDAAERKLLELAGEDARGRQLRRPLRSCCGRRLNVGRQRRQVRRAWFVHLQFKIGRFVQESCGNLGVRGCFSQPKHDRRLTHEVLFPDHLAFPVVSHQRRRHYSGIGYLFQTESTKVNLRAGCAPEDTSFRKCSGFKLGYCEIQLRPLIVKVGQYPRRYRNRPRNENFRCTSRCGDPITGGATGRPCGGAAVHASEPDVRFEAHCGLKSDIAPCPKSARSGLLQRARTSLFDHLACAGQQRLRNAEAERLGSLEIDD
jgi:hypothetical protein